MFGGLSVCSTWRGGAFLAGAAALLLGALLIVVYTPPAHALPSFARQTGQPCGTCHTDYAGLTPYGRRFKIEGYTAGGGPYRPTLFPSSDDTHDQKHWVPPISMMTIVGFTNTQAPLPPPTAPYNANNNVVVSPVSFFWGGAITDHIGAFAQLTYNAPPPGGFGTDPFAAHTWTWDNTDVRYANSTRFGSLSVTYGITANNGPTVQDPGTRLRPGVFPTRSPHWATVSDRPRSSTAPLRHMSLALERTYSSTTCSTSKARSTRRFIRDTQNSLGTDPFNAPGLFDVAPYWRAAFEPHWGNHWIEVGTFGMTANVHPWAAAGTALTTTFPQTDQFTDVGFDTQYQYQGDNFWVTVRGSYIHEYQNLNASFANGLAANPANTLNEARAYASLAYGNNNRVVLTGQYFSTWGTPDALLFSGNANFSPNTNGWIAEIAYIPFISNFAPGWPWFNMRLGLQYTWYTEFNGTSVGASANNTLFLYAWFAM